MPDVGRDDGNGAANVGLPLVRDLPRRLDARSPALPFRPIAGLRIDHVLLRAVRIEEAGSSACALADGRIELPANTVFEGQAAGDFPGILEVGIDVVAADGRWPDVFATGKVGRRYGNGISEGAARQETRQRIRQRIPRIDIVHSAF